ncbi:cerebellin-3-like [Mercenaria mercenaria]|uniref:cerebellin-3-like n=1 Tax=Mercenaria mercenaria TaxID=6596 RepID=UPI00234E68EC|nr:cerebellin-3-like [Mercenaria mercenaria]
MNYKVITILTYLSLCYCHIGDTSKYTSKDIGQLVENWESKFADVYKQLEIVNLGWQKEIAINKEFREKLAIQEHAIEKLRGQRDVQSIIRKGRQGSEVVAFTAYLDHEMTNLGPDHTIQFGAVELNEGGAYNNNTGVFTAPMDGVYLFSFAVEDYHPHRLWTKLVVDGQLKASVIEWPGPNHNNAQGSNTVVLRLTSGQSVLVAVDSRESGDSLQGWSNLRSTMFTGVYLGP